MPRAPKPPRLWLRPERPRHASLWFILDGGRQYGTGCGPNEVAEAEKALAEYIATKHRPASDRAPIETIPVADVLSIYLDDCEARGIATDRQRGRIERLLDHFGLMMLSDVNGESCRAYARKRTPGGARRDLEDLRSAIRHHEKEGLHREVVRVWLPPKGAPRDRWLTRSEAAALIWACWRYREAQRRHRGDATGETLPTRKRPLAHVARFILIGLYTGTRAGSIAAASFDRADGASHIDLERGVFDRLPSGRRATNKRQPPVRLPPRLLAHLRRWHAAGQTYAVEYNGKPVASVKTGFGHAVELAGLPGTVTPHTLRHTAATWLMQNGADLWQAAGYLGMTVETLERTYGHHHPGHMAGAIAAITRRPGFVGVSLVHENPVSAK